MKIQPVWWFAGTVCLIYNAIIYVSWAALDVDFKNMFAGDAALRNLVLPLGLGAIFAILAVSLLRWWRPVMIEDKRGSPNWALWPVVAGMIGMIGTNVASTDWSALAAVHLLLLFAAGVLVGVNEMTRGILLAGWRGSTSNEAWVWFWVTLVFVILRLPMALFGPGILGGLLQLAFAFCAGTGYYIMRRLSGSLVLPMLMHGAWDFTNYTVRASAGDLPSVRYFFQYGTYLASIVLVAVVLLADRRMVRSGAGRTPSGLTGDPA